MVTRDQDAVTTAVLLLGGGAAGYALGRLVIDRERSTSQSMAAQVGASLAATAGTPAALVGAAASAGIPASGASAAAPRPQATTRRPSASQPAARPASPSAQVTRPPLIANPPAPTALQGPTMTMRPTATPVDPYSPIPTIGATQRPIAGPPPNAQPIDPYANPSPSTPPHVLVGPPVTAVPIDPYAMPSQPTAAAPAAAGPITSPSRLDPAASAALGAELATVLTSTDQSTASRRPALPSTPAHAGPITSPAQVATPVPTRVASRLDLEIGPVTILSSSAPAPIPSSRLPRRFDTVFDRYRGSIPIEYLRALVARESSFNASARTASAIGLMQIIPVVLDDYNKRHGTAYQREHLVDPSINVAIGCELLRLIIAGYRRYHPRVPNLQENWDNPRFAELLVLGWNAGFSEAGGVGRVARYLEARGTFDITIDRVHEHARAAGASKHLSNPAKVRWCKSVVALYLRERATFRAQRVAARSLANPY